MYSVKPIPVLFLDIDDMEYSAKDGIHYEVAGWGLTELQVSHFSKSFLLLFDASKEGIITTRIFLDRSVMGCRVGSRVGEGFFPGPIGQHNGQEINIRQVNLNIIFTCMFLQISVVQYKIIYYLFHSKFYAP